MRQRDDDSDDPVGSDGLSRTDRAMIGGFFVGWLVGGLFVYVLMRATG